MAVSTVRDCIGLKTVCVRLQCKTGNFDVITTDKCKFGMWSLFGILR